MNVFAKLCITGLACLLPLAAQASVLTFRYTATLDYMVALNPATGNYEGVYDETEFAGISFKAGDLISGTFRYDTAVTPDQEEADPEYRTAYYVRSPADFMNYRFERTGYSFAAGAVLDPSGTAHVRDVAPGTQGRSDELHLAMFNSDDQFERSMFLEFGDHSGSMFNDTSMPAALDLGQLDRLSMSGAFRGLNDDRWMGFGAQITLLEQVSSDVPEPGSLLLLAAGATGLLASRRRKRTALIR